MSSLSPELPCGELLRKSAVLPSFRSSSCQQQPVSRGSAVSTRPRTRAQAALELWCWLTVRGPGRLGAGPRGPAGVSSPWRLSGPACRAAGLEGVATLSERDVVLPGAPGLLTVIACVHTPAGRPGHSGSLAGSLGVGDACASLLGFWWRSTSTVETGPGRPWWQAGC